MLSHSTAQTERANGTLQSLKTGPIPSFSMSLNLAYRFVNIHKQYRGT
jgi:hypothetical protein